jgi:cell wall-associated NlpC family hydrolase
MSDERTVRRAAVGVPVATVWASPDAPRPADSVALGPDPDIGGWVASLGDEQRLSLTGRVVTQALWGDQVLVKEEAGGWARIVLPAQPSSLDAEGYPGWIPSAQLAEWTPVPASSAAPAGDRYVVTTPTAPAIVPGRYAAVPVSFGTEVCRCTPPAAGPPRHAWVRARSGHSMWLPVGCLAPGDDVSDPEADSAGITRSAMSFVGLLYLWGGTSGFGLDCSGFVWLVLRRHGITIPRDAHDQAAGGEPVSLGMLQPADLVFFAEQPGGHVHHAGMALGDGQMIHAPRTGRPIEVVSLPRHPHASEPACARRYR